MVKAFVVLTADFKSRDHKELIKELQTHVKSVTAPYKYPRKVNYPLNTFNLIHLKGFCRSHLFTLCKALLLIMIFNIMIFNHDLSDSLLFHHFVYFFSPDWVCRSAAQDSKWENKTSGVKKEGMGTANELKLELRNQM